MAPGESVVVGETDREVTLIFSDGPTRYLLEPELARALAGAMVERAMALEGARRAPPLWLQAFMAGAFLGMLAVVLWESL